MRLSSLANVAPPKKATVVLPGCSSQNLTANHVTLHERQGIFEFSPFNRDSKVNMAHLEQEQLTERQQLALQQFTSVTQDRENAIPILQRSQWNVEVGRYIFTSSQRQKITDRSPDCHSEVLRRRSR